ncbi:hypothetical protein BH10PSE17_BH10PSE17_29520 [soil metagenome]
MQMVTRLVVLLAIFGMVSCGGGGSSDSGSGTTTPTTPGVGTPTTPTGPAPTVPGAQSAAFYSEFRTGKKLMLHEATLTPAVVRDNLGVIESKLDSYDGGFVALPVNGTKVMSTTALDYAAVITELTPLYAAKPTKFKYLFAVVKDAKVTNDPFDDWSQVVKNWATMAKAVKDSGMVGIVFDNEQLTGLLNVYPTDVQKASIFTKDDYQAQIRFRGKEIIRAIEAEFPDIVILFMRGPSVAEPRTPARFVTRSPDDAPLAGALFMGFAQGKQSRSLIVDGGNDYQLRTEEQFAASVKWRGTDMGADATGSQLVPSDLRNDAWPAAVSTAQGLRDLDGFDQVTDPFDPALWTATVSRAVKAGPNIVWTTFRGLNFDIVKAAATDPFVTGLKKATVAAAGGDALNPSLTPGSGRGLMAQYYLGFDYSTLYVTRVDGVIDYDWGDSGPTPSNLSDTSNYCVLWSGYLEAPTTGTYTINARSDDGVRVTINGAVAIDAFYFQGATDHTADIPLVAGQRVPIQVEYFQGGGGAEVRLQWAPVGGVLSAIPTSALYPY